MSDADLDLLSTMADTFRFSEALEHMNRRQFYNCAPRANRPDLTRSLPQERLVRGRRPRRDQLFFAAGHHCAAVGTCAPRPHRRHPDMLDIAIPGEPGHRA